MKKKIIWMLICVWNVTAREWNQAESADFEYKENNANARAQSSDGQNISLEDVLQETETSIQYGELNSESKTENITGNSENSSTDNEKDDEEKDADDSIKTESTKNTADDTYNTVREDKTIKNDLEEDESDEDSYEYETGYIFVGDSDFI